MLPPPNHPPSQVACGKRRDRRQLLCALSKGCVLFHINDKEESRSKKSLSYTHLFKKRASLTIQPAGVRRNPVKAWGSCVNDKRWKQPHFLWLKQGLRAVGLYQNQGHLYAFQWVYSCMKKEALLHCTVISLLLLSHSFILNNGSGPSPWLTNKPLFILFFLQQKEKPVVRN